MKTLHVIWLYGNEMKVLRSSLSKGQLN